MFTVLKNPPYRLYRKEGMYNSESAADKLLDYSTNSRNTISTLSPLMGRTAAGVRGMTLDDENDEAIGMVCIKDTEKETILVVSEQGYGKRSKIDDYRITNRGGKGVKTINVTEKTGKLVGIKNVTEENDLMIINKSGITIRMKVADLNIIDRATQGVRLINLEKRNDEIASVCKVVSESEENKIGDGETEEVTNEIKPENSTEVIEDNNNMIEEEKE